MKPILRILLALTVFVAAVAGLAACGGGGAGADTDVDTLLDKTFSGDKQVDSGRLDLKLKMNVSGGGSRLSGPVDVSLSGPFEREGDTKLPKFDLDLSFTGAGQSIRAGVENTGSKGFVNFNGQEYAVSDEVYEQFKSGFEQAAAQGSEKSKDKGFASLGINPKNWLVDPKNAGEGKVGDAEVIKITGGVDVARLLDDVNEALSKAGSLGLSGQAALPRRLTEAQKAQVEKAVKDVDVEIATGKEDTILRRMLIALDVVDPEGGGGKAAVTLDLSLLEVNEGQDFPEPENAKPFEELVSQLGGLGGLGALGRGGSSSGGSGSSGSGGSGTSQADLDKYTRCLRKAGQDLDKAQRCAEILTP